jgi:hypothetical protein
MIAPEDTTTHCRPAGIAVGATRATPPSGSARRARRSSPDVDPSPRSTPPADRFSLSVGANRLTPNGAGRE